MSRNMIENMLAELRGEEYIAAVRAIAATARARGGRLRCGGESCPHPAVWIGMQKCGTGGGPVCERHRQEQRQWMATAVMLGRPYCRHCGEDVDCSHLYVVPIVEGEATDV
ncbi:hypothetical protein VT930_11815 [Mycobacterium sherrisii]|uniref:hypothetical protein n=1 Tax=Mycobacterium sherrisii TaxID=243061 RepID=UPI002DDD48B0|nr:hypothetical protein [Mycobacterium sherrisii]MEC4763790.1 hypothetical protein [Mycobacterium sherrisii]